MTTFVRPRALIDQRAVGLQVALTFLVYCAQLCAHLLWQPYAYRYQNRLETGLSCTAMCFILLGYLFFFVHDAAWYVAATFVNALLFVVLLGPVAFVFGWNLNRYCYARFHAAWYEYEGSQTSAPLVASLAVGSTTGAAASSTAALPTLADDAGDVGEQILG